MIRLEHPEGAPGVALVVLDRPEKRNALTPDMLRNLAGAAERAHGAGAGALVLAGEGPVFCSGFDLSLCRGDSGAMAELLTTLSRAIRALRGLTTPVVCAAHGGAVAGGCALLGGCDIVVTDRAAKLGYPVVRLGVSPAVTTPTLRMALGDGHTRERTLSPELVGGEEAVRIGLAHECVETAQRVRERALEIGASLAAKPRHSMAATKRWLNELDGSNDGDALDRALGASLALAGGEEERGRLAALWK